MLPENDSGLEKPHIIQTRVKNHVATKNVS